MRGTTTNKQDNLQNVNFRELKIGGLMNIFQISTQLPDHKKGPKKQRFNEKRSVFEVFLSL